MRKGFTLLELVIVVIIVGILASVGLVNYGPIKEKTLDKEARVNLKLIRAAEKIYNMEVGSFYPSSGVESDIAQINENLKLALPVADTRTWNYQVCSAGCYMACRNGSNHRSFYITNVIEEPSSGGCSMYSGCGAGCPK